MLPFVAKVFGWHPFLAFPTRPDAPLWWIVSAAVIVVAAVLLMALDGVKVDLVKRDVPPRGGAPTDLTKRDA